MLVNPALLTFDEISHSVVTMCMGVANLAMTKRGSAGVANLLLSCEHDCFCVLAWILPCSIVTSNFQDISSEQIQQQKFKINKIDIDV
jgi:hypothetical protein